MDKVYVLYGACGEYSDHIEWMVAVYTTLEQAENHKTLAQEYINKTPKVNYKNPGYQMELQARRKYIIDNPYDPQCPSDYSSDADYHVEEVPYVRHVDEFQDFSPKSEDYIVH